MAGRSGCFSKGVIIVRKFISLSITLPEGLTVCAHTHAHVFFDVCGSFVSLLFVLPSITVCVCVHVILGLLHCLGVAVFLCALIHHYYGLYSSLPVSATVFCLYE